MHIVGLEVENFQRIKAVQLKPDGSGSVIVSGANEQGKTSLLDAIWATLGGKAGNNSARPVRDGAAQARVEIDLGDMIVTRVWRNGTTAVRVKSKDGAEYKSPQALLDSFIGRNTFDPLAFTRLKAREQREALLDLVDLDVDVSALDAARAAAFEERTEVGRRKSALGAAPVVDENLPRVEVSVSDLLQRINAARDQEALNQADRAKLSALQDKSASVRGELQRARELVLKLEAEEAIVAGEIVAQQAVVDNLTYPEDISELEIAVAEVEATNAAIRANNTAIEIIEAIKARSAEYDALTEKIREIDAEKAAALARAVFPVDGLGFDDEGVTFNGQPFSVASSAQKIRVSMAMAIAANPKLRVARIMDGSLLDAKSMKLISDLAVDNDFQVWIEVVADGQGVGFEIEDGELVNG